MTPVIPLFFIIFLEGYIVLSVEMLAIRLLVPFTGSGTDTVSIIIAAVLMPLAFGYFAGGHFKTRKIPGRRAFSARDRLIFNLVTAAAILTPGLSHSFLELAFHTATLDFGWNNRLWLTTVYCLLFLVVPVFLLGQTVPLVSNYFSSRRLPVIAGRILFFSTLGSFMGAVFCTLILMSLVGVHNTVIVTIAAMALLTMMLARKKFSAPVLLMTLSLALSLILNSGTAMAKFNIVKNNKYNLVQIEESDDGLTRLMKLNRTYAAAVYTDRYDQRLAYVAYIEKNFLEPLYSDFDAAPRDILILGAGGFTMGRMDDQNNYVYVDIDKDLKDISENLLLEEEILPNKKFVAMEARAYLGQTRDKYDLIILDLYRDPISAPEYLITREFFQQVRDHLKPGGMMAGNYFVSATFSDPFSINLDNTMRAVFPRLNRQVVNPYNAWDRDAAWTNIIYSAVNGDGAPGGIYTDDKNTSLFEKPVLLRHPEN